MHFQHWPFTDQLQLVADLQGVHRPWLSTPALESYTRFKMENHSNRGRLERSVYYTIIPKKRHTLRIGAVRLPQPQKNVILNLTTVCIGYNGSDIIHY